MTRFGIDALTAVRLARDSLTVPDRHQLVAPTLLRSQALSMIYREFRAGAIDREQSRALLDGITTMKVRLLGDRVSRGTAFRIADQLGWDDTPRAEYVAVAQLQADAFVTLDAELARGRGHRHDRAVRSAVRLTCVASSPVWDEFACAQRSLSQLGEITSCSWKITRSSATRMRSG